MDRWLPPRAPGANPPPRFEVAPPDEERAGPDDDGRAGDEATGRRAGDQGRGAESPAAEGESGAPTVRGWAPPTARRDSRRAPAPVRPTAPAAATPPPGTAPPPMPPRAAARPRSALGERDAQPNATAAWGLVLGIAGLVLLLLSLGTLFLVTLPCSAGAWALGRRAAQRIERGETDRGRGQASAALWLGRIGVLAGVAAMVALIVLTLSGVDLEQFREDLQRDLERRRDAAR